MHILRLTVVDTRKILNLIYDIFRKGAEGHKLHNLVYYT